MNKLKTAEPARAMCSPGRTHRAVGVGLASDRSIWFGFRPHDSRNSLPRDRKSEGQDKREGDETQEPTEKNAGSTVIDSV